MLAIKSLQNVAYELVVWRQSKTDKGIFEFDWVNDAASVTVKYIEGIFYFSDFLDWGFGRNVVLCLPYFGCLFYVRWFFNWWLWLYWLLTRHTEKCKYYDTSMINSAGISLIKYSLESSHSQQQTTPISQPENNLGNSPYHLKSVLLIVKIFSILKINKFYQKYQF